MDKIEAAHALCFHSSSLKRRNIGILTEAAIITELCPLTPIKLPNINALKKGQKFSRDVLEARAKNIAILSIYKRYLNLLQCCLKLARPNSKTPDFSTARYHILDDLAGVFKPVPNKVSLMLKTMRSSEEEDFETAGPAANPFPTASIEEEDDNSDDDQSPGLKFSVKESSSKAWWKGLKQKKSETAPTSSDQHDKSTKIMVDAIISCSHYAIKQDKKRKSSKKQDPKPTESISTHTSYSYAQMIDWRKSKDSRQFDKTLTFRQQYSIVEAASKALALLLSRLATFNHREILFDIAALAMNHPIDIVRENTRNALIKILRYDLDDALGGWSTLYIVKAMTSFAKKVDQDIHFPFYDILCEIPASKLTPTADDAVDLASHLGYENTSRRNIALREAQKRSKTRKKLAKRQASKRKNILEEERQREAHTKVGIKMNSMQRTIRQRILVALFAGYFRVMDKIVPKSTLFISTLMGLSRFAKCIKFDFMFDILGGLAEILKQSSQELLQISNETGETSTSSDSKPLNLDITTKFLIISTSWQLHSVVTDYTVSNSTTDLTEFETLNYALITELLSTLLTSIGIYPWNPSHFSLEELTIPQLPSGQLDPNLFSLISKHPDPRYSHLREYVALSSPLPTCIPLLLYNCYSSFLARKQFSTPRIASFIKRLLVSSLVMSPGGVLSILGFVIQVWKLYPQCAQVLSSEDLNITTDQDVFFFGPRDTNPDLAPSLNTPVPEINLLAHSYHPIISAVAKYLLLLDSPAASLKVARLGNKLPKLFSKFGPLTNQFDWMRWAKTSSCAIMSEYSSLSPTAPGGNYFSWEILHGQNDDEEEEEAGTYRRPRRPEYPLFNLFSPPLEPVPKSQLDIRLHKLFKHAITNSFDKNDDIQPVYPVIPKQISLFQSKINSILG